MKLAIMSKFVYTSNYECYTMKKHWYGNIPQLFEVMMPLGSSIEPTQPHAGKSQQSS